MDTHKEVEDVLHALQEVLAVVNLNVKFILNCIVNQYTSTNVKPVTFIVPMSFECNWDTVPPIWINVT